MTKILRNNVIALALAILLYFISFLFFDKPAAIWFHSNVNPAVYKTGEIFSLFADGDYIATIVTLCFILVILNDSIYRRKPWSKALLYICLSFAVACVIGESFKFLLGRYRPCMLFEKGLYGFHFLSGKWELNSSPSGHTLRIFSIMTALSLLYKCFLPAFAAFAILVGIGRVIVTAHYPGDVLFGAYIGIISAVWTWHYMQLKNKQ